MQRKLPNQAALHRDTLGIAGKVKHVAGVHKTLWSDEPETKPILNLAILTGQSKPLDCPPDDESDEDLIEPRRVKKTDPLVCDIGSLFTDFKG